MYNFVEMWYNCKDDGHGSLPEVNAMRTVISLIVSAVFAHYTSADFVLLFTVVETAFAAESYWNDTDDKNALH